MQRTPLSSRSLRSLGYDPDLAVLEVEFANGGVYQYHDVSLNDVRGILAADSRGTHFARVFQGSHPRFRRVA